MYKRQIYAGAGKVLQTARGAMFCLSQRAEHIWEGVSSATTRSRPIINTRDEPHADAERFRRLHVIVGDSNMSEYATFLKVGATSILLRMLEEPGVVLRDLTLEDPIRAIREISHDITCTRLVRLANGRDCLLYTSSSKVKTDGQISSQRPSPVHKSWSIHTFIGELSLLRGGREYARLSRHSQQLSLIHISSVPTSASNYQSRRPMTYVDVAFPTRWPASSETSASQNTTRSVPDATVATQVRMLPIRTGR